MNDTRNYLLEFIWIWVKAIILFAIGSWVSNMFLGGDEFAQKLIGYALASTVFGLSFFNKVIRFNLFGNTDGVILFWLLKFTISFVIGMLAFPIVNIYYIIKIIASFIKK